MCRQTRALFAMKKPPEPIYVTPPILKSNLHRIVADGARVRPSTKDLVPLLRPFRSLAQALVPRYSQGRRGTICHRAIETRGRMIARKRVIRSGLSDLGGIVASYSRGWHSVRGVG